MFLSIITGHGHTAEAVSEQRLEEKPTAACSSICCHLRSIHVCTGSQTGRLNSTQQSATRFHPLCRQKLNTCWEIIQVQSWSYFNCVLILQKVVWMVFGEEMVEGPAVTDGSLLAAWWEYRHRQMWWPQYAQTELTCIRARKYRHDAHENYISIYFNEENCFA